MRAIVDIPLKSIESAEVFVNRFRYSVDQVAAQAQAKRPDYKIYVVTGGMWNADGTPCRGLKVDGGLLSAEPWGDLADKTAYVGGEKVTGTMPDNGAVSGTIDGLSAASFSVPAGYTSGGSVSLTSDIEDALAAI